MIRHQGYVNQIMVRHRFVSTTIATIKKTDRVQWSQEWREIGMLIC